MLIKLLSVLHSRLRRPPLHLHKHNCPFSPLPTRSSSCYTISTSRNVMMKMLFLNSFQTFLSLFLPCWSADAVTSLDTALHCDWSLAYVARQQQRKVSLVCVCVCVFVCAYVYVFTPVTDSEMVNGERLLC